MYFDPIPYLRHLEHRLRQLEEKWALLEAKMQQVQRLLQELKPVHIDQVHYKIQELHLRDLSGTLNIGLTALSDPEQLEQWLKRQPAPGEIELEAGAAGGGGQAADEAAATYGETPYGEKGDADEGTS